MRKFFPVFLCLALLAGCDSDNPFIEDEPEETDGIDDLEVGDPNVSVSNRFAYDPAQRLTMNSVELDDGGTPLDPSDDQLIINNLPFDGPEGRYDRVETLANGAYVHQSRQTPTTGTTLTFAVFLKSDYLEASSAASGQWVDFGYAGANINRESFNLPGGVGEYIYRGSYAATRTFSTRGGIEIISGDVELRLDVLDFDPGEELQGAIDGRISNREREGAAGALGLGELPNIILAVTSFNTETGVWEGGSASTFLDDNQVRSSGEHEGMIAGDNGEEMGGYSIITGTADVQEVQYQRVTYRQTTRTPVLDPFTGTQAVDPVTGDPIFNEVVTINVASGLDGVELETLQNQINNRQNVQDYFPATGVPTGPDIEILGNEILSFDISTEYDAREIGVFIGDQVPG